MYWEVITLKPKAYLPSMGKSFNSEMSFRCERRTFVSKIIYKVSWNRWSQVKFCYVLHNTSSCFSYNYVQGHLKTSKFFFVKMILVSFALRFCKKTRKTETRTVKSPCIELLRAWMFQLQPTINEQQNVKIRKLTEVSMFWVCYLSYKIRNGRNLYITPRKQT